MIMLVMLVMPEKTVSEEYSVAPCRLFVDQQRLQAPALRAHLQLDAPCRPELRVQTLPYESVLPELQALSASLGPRDRVWISDKASCALTQAVPKVSTKVTATGASRCPLQVLAFMADSSVDCNHRANS